MHGFGNAGRAMWQALQPTKKMWDGLDITTRWPA